jgi:hypothetical protein
MSPDTGEKVQLADRLMLNRYSRTYLYFPPLAIEATAPGFLVSFSRPSSRRR